MCSNIASIASFIFEIVQNKHATLERDLQTMFQLDISIWDPMFGFLGVSYSGVAGSMVSVHFRFQ